MTSVSSTGQGLALQRGLWVSTGEEKPSSTSPWAGWQEESLKCPQAGHVGGSAACGVAVGSWSVTGRGLGVPSHNSWETRVRCLLGSGTVSESVILPAPAVPLGRAMACGSLPL